MKPKVFVSRRLPEKALDIIRQECEMELNLEDRVLTKKELIQGVRGKDGLLCLLTDTIDIDIMDASSKLKIIANYAVGFNNIDITAANKRKIMVTNTPGVLTETTADLAWALMMAVARRIVEADRLTRSGKFEGWDPMMFLGGDVYGKTLGIVGLGRIGKAIAQRAIGFRMKVLYSDVRPFTKTYKSGVATITFNLFSKLDIKYVSLPDLLRESDFVTVHVPLIPETIHLIGKKELDLMKKTAYLINTSRGLVVDEKALVRALKQGKIAGAGLDVYEKEPALTPGLTELENVVLLPHIASASVETRTRMAVMAAENLLRGLKGEIPPNLVNKEVLS